MVKLKIAAICGFTLIELLTIIVIIAVILTLALPIYRSIEDASKSAKCVGNMKLASMALFAYANDNRGYLPPIYRQYSPPLDNRYPVLFWTSLVTPYIDRDINDQIGQRIARCPERPVLRLKEDPKSNYTMGLSYGKASGADRIEDGVNTPLLNSMDVRVLPLRDLTTTYILSDVQASVYPFSWWPGATSWGLKEDDNDIAFVHGNKTRANFLFGDGSIRSYTREQWRNNENNMWGSPWPY